MSQNICNICGANYEYRNGRWICPACGAYKAEELSPEEATLLNVAAQKLRLSDFDEAEKAYTDIIEKYPQNPNGYWGRLLSKYGIKYEEDFDGRKIPTCYATSIESVISDKDYAKAIALADKDTRAYYEKQAEYIERVRKEWVEKAKKEKPYDIFLCYKDSDLANGIDRTQDSIAVQDLYIHLTEQGYRVFFSRESLRGKVGEKYEPYIFNALSTAKVMLVYGSKPEYITSTWLKNEWARYEKRLQAGEKKPNSLIIACDGFSPAELPKVLSSRQCFDATKRSFYSDLDAIVKKIIKGEEKPKTVVEEKKKSKKLPLTIAAVAVAVLIAFCALIPTLFGNKPTSSIVDSKYGVVITAQDKIFDKNTSLVVDRSSSGAEYSALVSAVNDEKEVDLQSAIVYDIECNADLAGDITVKVAYTKNRADSEVKVFYVSDDKSIIEEHNCVYENGSVEFDTNHLSYYVVGEVLKSSNPGNDYSVTTHIEGLLQVGVCADYYPYEYIEDGQFKGIEVDILKKIATELGLEIRFENDKFENLLDNLINDDIDCIIGVTETTQRNESANASNPMFSEDDTEFIVYVDKFNSDLLETINTIIDQFNKDDTIWGVREHYMSLESQNPTYTTISFDANGGEGTMVSQKIPFNSSAKLNKCTFTREGYVFAGWTVWDGDEVIYLDEAVYTTTEVERYTLYAKWVREEYTVTHTLTFDANGGTGTVDSVSFKYGESVELPFNAFEKDGFEFIGWSTSKDGEVEYIEGATYRFETTQTLYAVWDAERVALVYDANGGEGSMQTSLLKPGQIISLNDNEFKREGYAFKGWSLEPNGSVVYKDTENFTMGASSVTLYAVWNPTDTYIVLKPNGGKGTETTITSETDETITLPLNEFTRDGYTFVGWATISYGEVKYEDGASYTSGPNLEYNLYAIWVANENEVVFNANGGVGTMAPQKIKTNQNANLNACTFTREGYIFAGWSASYSGGVEYSDQASYTMGTDAQYTLYAVWSTADYQITYVLNGGTNSLANPAGYDVDDATITLQDPTREGYTFNGWYTTSSFTTASNTIPTGSTGNKTFYASWTPKTYTITLNANGGTVSQSSVSATYDATLNLPTPSKTGYSFAGWVYASTKYSSGSTWKGTKNITLTAEWEPNTDTKYVVNHYLERANSSGYDLEDSQSLTGTTGASVTPSVNAYSYFNSPSAKTETIKADGTLVVDYYYTRQTYLVRFVTNGGNTISSVTYKHGQNANLPTPVRSGYTFGGWYQDEGMYNEFQESTITWEATLYAYWKEENKPSDFHYEGETEVTITWYQGSGTSVVVPAYIGGKPVRTIAERAFFQNTTIKSVTVPNTVTALGSSVFTYCTSLESVSLSDNVTVISDYAFDGCTKLATISISNNTTKIGNGAFSNCSVLTSISLPNSITEIGSGAFQFCSELSGISIPNKVVSIGANAFMRCTKIKAISLPQTLTTIGEGAFEGCSRLESLVIPGNVKTINRRAFYECTGLTEVVILSGVEEIGSSVFYGCDSINKMTLPFVGKSASATGYEAPFGYIFGYYTSSYSNGTDGVLQLYYGSNYYYYYIPSSISEVVITSQNVLPEGAFANCDFIESVTIPTTATELGDTSFKNCTSLKRLNSNVDGVYNIPANTTTIGASAFQNCTLLTDIVLLGDAGSKKLSYMGASAFSGCSNLVSFNSNIGSGRFEIPSKITVLSESIFYSCTQLKSLVFQDAVTTIDHGAFNECVNLCNINDSVDGKFYIPETITTIGRSAFRNVNLLEEIYIPETVTSMGYLAFDGCSATIKTTLVEAPSGWHGDWEGESNTIVWFYIGDIWDGTTAYTFAGGKGTEEEPYLISTAEQLAYVATSVNQGVNTFKGKYLTLTTNLHLMQKEWAPIGTETYSFEGVFDGGGYTIFGLKVSDETLDYGGLFGKIQDSTIRNLSVKEANVKISQSYGKVGIIVGYGYSTTQSVHIINCCAEGNVTLSQCGTVGGVAGYVYGDIMSSHFNGTVSGSAYNSGATIGVQSSVNVGGIAGTATTITNCYSEGSLTGTGGNLYYHTTYVGGIAGTANSVSNCYSTAAISSSGQEYSYAGGIVAKTMYDGSTIQNCFSASSITGTSYSSSDVYCGRIVAKCNANDTISNCYADSSKTITKNSTAYGTLQFTQTLQSESFIYETLGWGSDVWEIVEGQFPILK